MDELFTCGAKITVFLMTSNFVTYTIKLYENSTKNNVIINDFYYHVSTFI